MRISSFILVVDSYLLRKGVVSMLNRIQGIRVLKEFGSSDPFPAFLENHSVDFMIISQTAFTMWTDLFISKPELLEKTILLEEPHTEEPSTKKHVQGVPASIHLLENKESLIAKIRGLIDQGGDGEDGIHSMKLSSREITIVRLVSTGLTNRQIAEKLFLSAHTVMTHRKNITSKLGIKSVSGLTVYAIVNNIITIEEVSSLPAK
ncbi:MAG: LuxR C-terminal-related transcriptional regulator [Bacteroidales bacterium]|nr:LuxR C-terminal-related transcriptional regulator [Bacteroidales bacterium]